MVIGLWAFGIPGVFASMFIDSYLTVMDRNYVPITSTGRIISLGRALTDVASNALSSVRNQQPAQINPIIIIKQKRSETKDEKIYKDSRIMTQQPLNMYGYVGDVFNSYKFKSYRTVQIPYEVYSKKVISIDESFNITSTQMPILKNNLANCIPSSDCKFMGKVSDTVGNALKEAGSTFFKRILGKAIGLMLLSTIRLDLLEANA